VWTIGTCLHQFEIYFWTFLVIVTRRYATLLLLCFRNAIRQKEYIEIGITFWLFKLHSQTTRLACLNASNKCNHSMQDVQIQISVSKLGTLDCRTISSDCDFNFEIHCDFKLSLSICHRRLWLCIRVRVGKIVLCHNPKMFEFGIPFMILSGIESASMFFVFCELNYGHGPSSN